MRNTTLLRSNARASSQFGHESRAAETSSEQCTSRRLALMFTDIAQSTRMVVEMGDENWLALLRWHNDVVRACFGIHDGREVTHTGDGFFAVFECPLRALQCALEIQDRLAAARSGRGLGMHVRIGIQ